MARYFVRFGDGSGQWIKAKDLSKLRCRPNGHGTFEIVGAAPPARQSRAYTDGIGGGKWRVADRWRFPQTILDRRQWPTYQPVTRTLVSNGFPQRMNLAQEREEAGRKLKPHVP